MDKIEKTITFDNLPQAVATLLQEVRELRTLTENHTTYGGFSPWMDVDELCEYLPERCRRVNEWCRKLVKDNVLLISIHCNAAGRGDRWLSARG